MPKLVKVNKGNALISFCKAPWDTREQRALAIYLTEVIISEQYHYIKNSIGEFAN